MKNLKFYGMIILLALFAIALTSRVIFLRKLVYGDAGA